MKKQVTIDGFYEERGLYQKLNNEFNVFANEEYCNDPHIYSRRDFYKISLLLGKSRLSLHHQDIEINRPALIFFNPFTPFEWKPVSKKQPGFFCLFKKEFINGIERNESVHNSPLFKTGSNQVFFLDEVHQKFITDIFNKMLAEMDSAYIYKYELLRNYLNLVIHAALKMEPTSILSGNKNAAERISLLFFDMLERQFPIDSPDRTIKLKTPGDYAKALRVHVNHLNHTVKVVSGKSTSFHISQRILAEAKAMLRHTDWPVSTIASSLGFEYSNYFNNFFKRKTGHSPKLIRADIV
jgi:AraC-like DNA-binding protein